MIGLRAIVMVLPSAGLPPRAQRAWPGDTLATARSGAGPLFRGDLAHRARNRDSPHRKQLELPKLGEDARRLLTLPGHRPVIRSEA